jgi:hypothetical protein
MNRTTLLASLGFAFSGLMISGPAQAGEPPPPNLAGTKQFAYCMSGYLDYTGPSAHFSPVFEIHVPQNAKVSYPEDLANVYEGFLKQKYGYVRTGPLSVVCTFSVAAAAVEGGKSEVIKDTKYRQRNVIETGWKPSAQEIMAAASATAAPAVSVAPKPNPGTTYYGYCKGDQSSTKIYYSAVFSTLISPPPSQLSAEETRPTVEKLAKSFSAFLAGRYGFNGSSECNLGPTKSNIEWTWSRLKGLALNARDRFIETGWTPGG